MGLDNREEEIHETVTLLPWYLHGSLTEAEREQVEHHLRACAACHQELEVLRQLYSLAQEARAGQPGPSPDLFQRVMARREVHGEVTQGETYHKRGEKRTAWSHQVGTWMHSLFAAPWVPTFATVLILMQCVIIASLLGAFYMREPEQYIVITRAESEQPKARGTQPAAYWVRIQVAFVKDGLEWQIRNFLHRVQVLVNGKEVITDARGPNLDPQAARAELQVDLAGAPLKPGEPNTIEVIVWNAAGYLSSRGAKIL